MLHNSLLFFKGMWASLILAIFLCPSTVSAGVNLKNGNFYISYTDAAIPGAGELLKITRTYNSKATEVGWFGFGWGSDFETFIDLSNDGTITVHENGAGAHTRFRPKSPIISIEDAVDDLLKAYIRAGNVKTLINMEVLKEKLETNAELRHAYSTNAIQQGWVEAVRPAPGTVLYSNERGRQTIEVRADDYVRTHSNGEREIYDLDGRLRSVEDRSGFSLSFDWSDDGKNLRISNNVDGLRLSAKFREDGRIVSIASPEFNSQAQFEYYDSNLIASRDLVGNEYEYVYDDNHNLISINYTDGTGTKIEYEPTTQFARLVEKKDGSGGKYEYYAYDNPDREIFEHYGTSASQLQNGKLKPGDKNIYEYKIKTGNSGEQYTSEIRTLVNGVLTETDYNACGGLPEKIRRGARTTFFEYNDDCNLSRKIAPNGDEIRLEYHPDHKKITRLFRNNRWTEFSYNGFGDLVFAEDSRGKSVNLGYDDKHRIVSMITRDGEVLLFEYNNSGKPIRIEILDVGKINVNYDRFGNITSVNSDQGQKMALRVTRAFQDLLTIVRPAGVNLNL